MQVTISSKEQVSIHFTVEHKHSHINISFSTALTDPTNKTNQQQIKSNNLLIKNKKQILIKKTKEPCSKACVLCVTGF